MNIAYVLTDPGIPVFGTKGASVHVQEIVRAMRAAGHAVTVYCVRRGDRVPADLADLPVVEVPVASTRDTAAREKAVAEAARALATRCVLDGTAEFVYERYALFGTAGAVVSRALGVPLVLEVNAPLVEEQARHRELVDAHGARTASEVSMRSADRVACVSHGVAAWVGEEFGITAEVVPNGVNTERIVPRSSSDSPAADRPLRLGFVGTLKPWHGTADALTALALVLAETRDLHPRPPVVLDVYGTGPEEDELRDQAARLGIEEAVTFHGAIDPSEIPAALRDIDVALAPYPDGEHYFSPLKIYEYMAAGLPIVASEIGVVGDVLRDLGILVPPGDPASIALAVRHLHRDPGLRRRLGERARTAAVAEHDWSARLDGLLSELAPRVPLGTGS